jgi:chemotaxis protein MotA
MSAMVLGVGVGAYIDVPSVLIVVGGSLGALLISYDISHVKKMGKLIMISIKPTKIEVDTLIKIIIELAIKARRDGIISLEADANNEENFFLKKGLMMAVDGSEPDVVKNLMEVEIEQLSNRHKTNSSIFGTWSGLAGAFGLIGTLIGLIAMLVNMSDPAAIGPSMAVALLTTMYGAMLGNIIGGPVENILTLRNTDEMVVKTLIIEGIMSIQAGDNPRILESKLMAFLAPSDRDSQFDK